MLNGSGQHVRGAATVGGNLALARNRRLESDLAPLLLAAGARVTLASADGLRCVEILTLVPESSDLVPLLLAAGARVTLASADGLRCAETLNPDPCCVHSLAAVGTTPSIHLHQQPPFML